MAEENEYADLLGTGDLNDGEMGAYDHPGGGQKLLVVRVGDAFYITQEHCAHMGGNLAKGKLIQPTVVQCPLHHSRYDVTDGHVVRWTDWTGPLDSMNKAVRHPRPLQTYDVKVEADRVLVGPPRPCVPPPE